MAGPGFRQLYRRVIRVTSISDDITTFPDVTGDSVPDLAGFVGGPNTKAQINTYSGANGAVQSNIKFLTTKHRGIALGTVRNANQDGTANDTAISVLTDHDVSKRIYVETRRVDNGVSIGKIKFLNADWRAIYVAGIDDADGNGITDDT